MTAPGIITLGSLVLEFPALQTRNWYAYLETYLQDGGGFALMGLVIWMIAAFAQSLSPRAGRRGGVPMFILGVTLVSLAFFAVGGAGYLIAIIRASQDTETAAQVSMAPIGYQVNPQGTWWNHAMTVGFSGVGQAVRLNSS